MFNVMRFQTEHIYRRFKPKVVDRVTGINPVQQRTWRRRGHLPPLNVGERAVFDIYDVAQLYVAAELMSGVWKASEALKLAEIARLNCVAAMLFDERAVAFDGDPVSEKLQKAQRHSVQSDIGSRHKFVAVGRECVTNEVRLTTFDDGAGYDAATSSEAVMTWTVIDCDFVALELLKLIEMPIVTIRNTKVERDD